MMSLRLCLVVMALCATIVGLERRGRAQGSAAKTPKETGPAFAPIQDDPSLPRVLLIGDSISIGYTLPVRAALAKKANIHRIPVNGGPTTDGLAGLDEWLGDGHWDVIHFNWGLHDLKLINGKHQVPLEQYEQNLRKLVERLMRTKAKLIWCSTTPVPPHVKRPPRRTEDVIPYNAAAKKVMAENGVAINDLYAFALPRLRKIQRPANVHFTAEGSTVLASQVSAAILKALEKSTTPK